MELTTTEKKIIALLKKGQQQAEIAEYFRNNESFNINSQSAVEKIIMGLKKKFGVKTMFQLGVVIGKLEKWFINKFQ